MPLFPLFFFEKVTPTPLKKVTLLHHTELAKFLGLGSLTPHELQSWLNGESRIPGDQRISTRYAGHQFGVWAGQLGDGRAISLGELITHKMGRQEIQVKGLGMTPFSRRGDGKAVLRSSLREYLCAEAMDALGIPTTRSLALMMGEGAVEREEIEFEATTTRVFPTQIRFGHFEMAFHFGKKSELQALVEYTRSQFFDGASIEEMLHAVMDKTARMIALWQSVGFCHGVMNTDNLSILGLTLDYGPFGFMEDFNPHHICNHSDREGRYAYSEQPRVGMWNLERLFVCFSDLVTRERLIALLETYPARFQTHLLGAYRKKLGLQEERPEDLGLIESLLEMLAESKFDYTFFFRSLSRYQAGRLESLAGFRDHYPESLESSSFLARWLTRYQERLILEGSVDSKRSAQMLGVNPKFVLRNPLAQEIIASTSAGKTEALSAWYQVLRSPFQEHPEVETWAGPLPPNLKNRILSCSS
ncbi:MAG: YdiU family protein [Bdellovibrionales bacterium]|nr:YdiU family protein [Bdellovibrionales bacterium]